MSKFWEKFFYIFAYITQGSSYLSPYAYGILHRMHHAYTDTEKDPHSPKHFPNLFAMMWHTRNIYSGIFKKKIQPEQQFLKNLPNWIAFDKIANSGVSKILWACAYTAFYIFFAPSGWWFLLLPFTITMGPLHGAIINWFAHKYGYVNFKQKNTSRNLLPVDVLMLGESYHNDHHEHPSNANWGARWCVIDPVYYIILLLNKLNIVRLKTAEHL
jgi:stearoyl-CoA desaturase (delta-9 desaturase)